jgi:hypothetical protein
MTEFTGCELHLARHCGAGDLPLNVHRAAIRASAGFTPLGAGLLAYGDAALNPLPVRVHYGITHYGITLGITLTLT